MKNIWKKKIKEKINEEEKEITIDSNSFPNLNEDEITLLNECLGKLKKSEKKIKTEFDIKKITDFNEKNSLFEYMKEINLKNTNGIINSTISELVYHLLTDKHQSFHPEITLLNGKCNMCSNEIAQSLGIIKDKSDKISKFKKKGHFLNEINKFSNHHYHFDGNFNKLLKCNIIIKKNRE